MKKQIALGYIKRKCYIKLSILLVNHRFIKLPARKSHISFLINGDKNRFCTFFTAVEKLTELQKSEIENGLH